MKDIILRIDNVNVCFGPAMCLPLEKTNLPFGQFSFREGRDVFWRARMTGWDKDTGTLILQITDYQALESDGYGQRQAQAEINRVDFDGLDWARLEPLLSYYEKKAFSSIFSDTQVYYTRASIQAVRFRQRIDTMRFESGKVTFTKSLKWLNEPVRFEVPNTHIMSYFDYLKPFVIRRLGKKTMDISAKISHRQGVFVKAETTSQDIALIDQDWIGSLHLDVLRGLGQSPKVKLVDKSLFTSDDLMDGDEEVLGDASFADFEALIHDFMGTRRARNYRQIQYLAALHDLNDKIRISLSPQVGFLFRICGEQKDHFIWELINSHATYIWSFERTMSERAQIRYLESALSFIRHQGRELYKTEWNPDEDVLFHVIRHVGAGQGLVDGFGSWKNRLNEKLG